MLQNQSKIEDWGLEELSSRSSRSYALRGNAHLEALPLVIGGIPSFYLGTRNEKRELWNRNNSQ